MKGNRASWREEGNNGNKSLTEWKAQHKTLILCSSNTTHSQRAREHQAVRHVYALKYTHIFSILRTTKMAERYTYKIDWRLCEHSAVVFAIRNEDFYCSNDSKLFSRFAIHSSHSAAHIAWNYYTMWMNEWMNGSGGRI